MGAQDNKVRVHVYYTDAEEVTEKFGSLERCLDYLKDEIVDKNEFVDRIVMDIC